MYVILNFVKTQTKQRSYNVPFTTKMLPLRLKVMPNLYNFIAILPPLFAHLCFNKTLNVARKLNHEANNFNHKSQIMVNPSNNFVFSNFHLNQVLIHLEPSPWLSPLKRRRESTKLTKWQTKLSLFGGFLLVEHGGIIKWQYFKSSFVQSHFNLWVMLTEKELLLCPLVNDTVNEMEHLFLSWCHKIGQVYVR